MTFAFNISHSTYLMLAPHTKDNYIMSKRRVFGLEPVFYMSSTFDHSEGKFWMCEKRVRVSKKTVLSTDEEPCSDDRFDNLKVCVERYYEDHLNCTLPWTQTSRTNSKQRRRSCSKTKDLRELRRKTKILSNLKQAALFKELNCRMPCTTIEYNLESSWEGYFSCDFEGCNEFIVIRFAIFDHNLYWSKENWLYTGNNFIADFGGYLGLLLGASAFSGYEWIKTGVRKLKNK